jgi:hypothetical protein
VLQTAGLITRGRNGQRRPSRLDATPLVEATAWIERYREIWERNYHRLDDLLNEGVPGEPSIPSETDGD